jgi:hypothetical protein
MKKIILSWQEFEVVSGVGVRQCFSSWKKGSRDAHGFNAHSLFDHTITALGAEFAVAKSLNKLWSGNYDQYKKLADVGENIEVRHTRSNPPKLILRPNSDEKMNQRHFFLVTSDIKAGEYPCYYIHGHIKGEDGMKDEYLNDLGYPDRPKCWAIPTSELNTNF